MRGRWHDWLGYIEEIQSELEEARSGRSWLLLMAFVLGMLAVCWWVPAAQDLTGLPIGGSLIAVAVLSSSFVADTIAVRSKLGARPLMATILITSTVVELFPALLVGLSHMPGTALFAGFYLLAAVAHCQLFRFSRRFPLLALAFVCHALISLAINHDVVHLVTWALLLPGSALAGYAVGTASLQRDENRREIDRTRAALSAQLLDLEAAKQRRLEDRLNGLLGVQHDLKSPIMAASMELDGLVAALGSARTLSRDEVVEYAASAAAALRRLRALFDGQRSKVERPGLATEVQDVASILESIQSRTRRRFPATTFHVHIEGTAHASIVGGAPTLERIVDNVIVNACEGNGQQGAHNVWCSVTCTDGMLARACDDDGPGFPAWALADEIESFRSTKTHGTGLGLFTVERLVRACGGAVERANRAEGGARVVVRLPQASAPAV